MKYMFRYSVIHAMYWIVYCAIHGFASVVLLGRGYSNAQIGLFLAIANVFAVVGQPILAAQIDAAEKLSSRIVTIILMLGTGIFAGLLCGFHGNGLVVTICFMGAYGLHWTAQPFVNEMGMEAENIGLQVNYGVARAIGSFSFAIFSAILGNVADHFGSDFLFIVTIIFSVFCICAVYMFQFPKNVQKTEDNDSECSSVRKKEVFDPKEKKKNQTTLIGFAKKYSNFTWVLLGTYFIFVDHNVINDFFKQIVDAIGGTNSDMGYAVSFAAVMELFPMILFQKLKEKINCGTLLKISAIAFLLKGFLIAIAPNMTLVYISQFLQIAGYGLYFPAIVYFTNASIPRADKVKGQAYLTTAITLGTLTGNVIGGTMLEYTSVSAMLYFCAILCASGMMIVLWKVHPVNGYKI